MKDFILSLYANENFPIYLGIAIAILLIAFGIVFFLGKKDKKKIEETQKLEAINTNAFAQTNVPSVDPATMATPIDPVSMTPAASVTPIPMPEASVAPVAPMPMSEAPVAPVAPMPMPEAPIAPVAPMPMPEAPVVPVAPMPMPEAPVAPIAPMPMPEIPTLIQTEQITNPFENIITDEVPTIPNNMSQMGLLDGVNNTLDNASSSIVSTMSEVPTIENNYVNPVKLNEYNELSASIDNELSSLESMVKPAPVANPTKVVDVFSSVYAPKKEEPIIEDTMEIELPKLKTEEPVLNETKEDSLNI